jgi:hypothetical protein
MSEICKFEFKRGISKSLIEEQLAFAIIAAECTFGQAKVRLYASYAASEGNLVIDVSSDIGGYIAQVFTGLAIRKIGEKRFTVERISKNKI